MQPPAQQSTTVPLPPPATDTLSTTVHNEQLLFEYDQLRKEILQNDGTRLQIITITLFISSALMGFAFSEQISDNPLRFAIFYLVEMVLLIGMYQNRDILRNTLIIGAYLNIFIEPHLSGVNWESRLQKFRKAPPKWGDRGLISDQNMLYIILILLNLTLGTYFYWMEFAVGIPQLYSAVFILLVVGTTLFFLTRYWLEYRVLDTTAIEMYRQAWIAILEAGSR